MSARDDILRQFSHNERTDLELTTLLDAYAHELAENVMELRSVVPDLKARQLFKDGYDAALMVAALTIDPEVK